VQQLSDPPAVADDQQVGTVCLVDEHWARRAADHALPQGNLRRPIRVSRQCGFHDLGELALGPRFLLGLWWHWLAGDFGFPPLGHYRRPAADCTHLGADPGGVRQCPSQRGVAGRGAVDTDHHHLLAHLNLLTAEMPSKSVMC
jgi:hypothetical protein